MTIADLLGWVATVVVLGSYALSTKWQKPRIFHWGNAIGWIPLAVSEVAVGAWPALLISVSFGLIGTWGLLRGADDT